MEQENVTDFFTEENPHRASLYSIDWLDYILFAFGIGVLTILLSMRKIMILHVPTNILIVNLATSDLGVGLFVMPFSVTSFFKLRDHTILYDQSEMCNIVGVLRQMLLCSSTYTIAAISYERFLGVKRPMSYKRIVNKKFALTTVAAIWFYSTIYSLVTVAMPAHVGAYVYNDYTGYCIQQWWFGTDVGETIEVVVNTVLNFVIPFASMGYYYSKVLTALHANLHFCFKMKVPSSFQAKFKKESKRLIFVFLEKIVCCESKLRKMIAAQADPTRKKMTPNDYARASIKYYATTRAKRLADAKVGSRMAVLRREDSEYNTSALVSYNVEDYSSPPSIELDDTDDLGGYGRLRQTVVVIHNQPNPNRLDSSYPRSKRKVTLNAAKLRKT
ncbi:5-hydroxytryptamine receptor 7-like [Bolinopsis microptera]|uniref:5-hydroxytryptamine receptor 7-like n=1 Tax=Bolinopsis microptera TaxID=2820187 RepID=UPI003078D3E5